MDDFGGPSFMEPPIGWGYIEDILRIGEEYDYYMTGWMEYKTNIDTLL